jgi:sterol desaturase/sphingolipid hydroxylase (fatty acid hydroxylase superfamily)
MLPLPAAGLVSRRAGEEFLSFMGIDYSPATLVAAIVASLLVAGGCIFLGGVAEGLWPARPRPLSAVAFNLAYLAPASLIQTLLAPLAAMLTTLAVNRLGGGLIPLPGAGWGLAVGVVVYLLAMDFAEYVFHRAQHRFPWLWAMHSLHHSDVNFNVSTTIRHFWLDLALKSLTVYVPVALLFRTPAPVVGIYALLTAYNYFAHMNVRVGFGRWAFVLNSPQYHRLHHSNRPQDHDRNFAALLPIFDVLFGAYSPPRAGDYPDTGLHAGVAPSNVAEALLWPFSAGGCRGADDQTILDIQK